MKIIVLFFLLVASTFAQSTNSYRWSVAAVTACAAADAGSSWGRVELNPVLAGQGQRFDGRSVALKAGITGAILGVGWLVQRRKPESRRAVTVGNFVTSAAWCSAAGWNVARR